VSIMWTIEGVTRAVMQLAVVFMAHASNIPWLCVTLVISDISTVVIEISDARRPDGNCCAI
jgi:hypothetical protein